jgi:hypothetical protein
MTVEAGHHVETWSDGRSYGWQCFTCGREEDGFNDWRPVEVAADEHRTQTKAAGS